HFMRFLLKDSSKAFSLSCIAIVLFFSYGHFYLAYSSSKISSHLPISPRLLMFGVYFLLSLAGLFLVLKSRYKHQIRQFFLICSLVVFVMPIIKIIPGEILEQYMKVRMDSYIRSNEKTIAITNKDASTYPNIIYIIYDRYARSDILTSYFDFDNSSHIKRLGSSGFITVSNAYANYPTTYLSLASSLNMSHLTYLDSMFGSSYRGRWLIYNRLLQTSTVATFLKQQGYRYFQLGSSWDGTKDSPLADENINQFEGTNQLSSYIYENSFLNALMGLLFHKQTFFGVTSLENHIKNVQLKRNRLALLASDEGPYFAFAHFLIPHPPNLLKPDCTPFTFEQIRARKEEDTYIDELKCANKMMEELALKVEKGSRRPTVVIFQSDEGPYLPKRYFGDQQMPDPLTAKAIKIHGPILLSIKAPETAYTKGTGEKYSYPKTPINIFPTILNYYFGSSIQHKSDRSYIAEDEKRPYHFIEITDILNK
ncbi:MAG: sulfatase-like hydrolase/transferase, partial [Candidatus Roizmanbacteria bacterium]